MNNIILLPIAILLLLFVNKKTVERFTVGAYDITEEGPEKGKTSNDSELVQRLNKMDEKIKEINQKLQEGNKKMIEEEEEEEEEEDEEEEEEEEDDDDDDDDDDDEGSIYSPFISWNKDMYDNYLINGLIVILTIILFITFTYFFSKFVIQFAKDRKLNIPKINVSYDTILDELTKKKLKGKLKIKKIKK
tara:strand:+ start:439 stop:1008 length:570 start_codon:yes stop_codon:yes gene_type:complete